MGDRPMQQRRGDGRQDDRKPAGYGDCAGDAGRNQARHIGIGFPRPGTGDEEENEGRDGGPSDRSEEHTSELQSLMRISYAVFCLKKKKKTTDLTPTNTYSSAHKIQKN